MEINFLSICRLKSMGLVSWFTIQNALTWPVQLWVVVTGSTRVTSGEEQEAHSLLHCQHMVTHCSLQVPSDVDLLIIWPSFNLTPKWAIGLKKIPAKKPCVKNNTNNTSTPEQDGGRADVSSSMSSLSATSWGKNNHNLIRSEMKSASKLKISRDNLKQEF